MGRTTVRASHYSSKPYEIYLNGRQVCEMSSDDDCTFQTRGTRAGGELEAYLDGQKVGSIEIRRTISPLSILLAPFTDCLSLWLYRAYPDDIEIPIETYMNEVNGSTTSVWDMPYKPANTEQDMSTAGEQSTGNGSIWD